ncbi:hypothetical protein Sjap_015206 [Stephania japonica]|uniref:cysteine dioxygenase n=1 Tax=Stephania japonica TaxID=461633 RepID=A0AAP0NSA3_9MAGN
MARSCSIQALFDLCKKTFTPSSSSSSGFPPPSSQSIHKLCSILDTIGPADVGLKEDNADDDRGHGFFGFNQFNRSSIQELLASEAILSFFHSRGGSNRQMAVKNDDFGHVKVIANVLQMCIFCLPSSSVIPLHDHPGMTVMSKVLYGSMHVKAYDWVEPACPLHFSGANSLDLNAFSFLLASWHDDLDIAFYCSKLNMKMHSLPHSLRLAKLAVDKVLAAPCGTSILYPRTGGNLHCFTSVTSCAVLDILAPPYREAAGRKCTYYNDYPYSSFSNETSSEIQDGKEEDYAWLQEIDTPVDLYMRQGEYVGPALRH